MVIYVGENSIMKFSRVQPASISPYGLLGLNAMVMAMIVGIMKNINNHPKGGMVTSHSPRFFLLCIPFMFLRILYSEGSVRRFSSVSAYVSNR